MMVQRPHETATISRRYLAAPDTNPSTGPSRRCHPGLAQSRGRLPRQRILILTTFGLDDYIIAALRAGASGFLLKDAPSAQVIEAVRAVAAGDAVLSPTVTRQLLDQVGRRLPAAVSQAPDALKQLTGVNARSWACSLPA